MIQLIGLLLVIVITKLVWDYVKEREGKPKVKPSKPNQGKVIDVGDRWSNKNNMPYRMQNHLITGKDLGLYQLFSELLKDSKYAAFPRVRLAEVITVPMTANNAEEYYNRIRDKTLDLVIFELPDLTPQVVISIEVSEDKRRGAGDSFSKKAIESCGLGYFSIDINSPQDIEKLKAELIELGLEL
ncbi:hypothetical protein SYNTR_1227 [Candidatus Syntrophocurvum alkaliphilum]|uniref:DUF2726 domain-containing protein n=1 Tax=Candidatus Syntrophocurvum alkaliphilum TaxID=2293317 RepID=A0A6I6DHK4_9FIRM|nr:DUF2726 domain-containing protein [Candidatus Syntrophocurvum alkaliphilum]QGT99820.1 hypothetical protein SYNTR_1227 [Candidatus Syntrophocurvum alkaliphilum]